MKNVFDLIRFYEQTPDDKWIKWQQCGSNDNHCAYGWVVIAKDAELSNALNQTIGKLNITPHPIKCREGWGWQSSSLADVNNGITNEYQQETPKQRVIAALIDLAYREYGIAVTTESITAQVAAENAVQAVKDILSQPTASHFYHFDVPGLIASATKSLVGKNIPRGTPELV